MWGPLGIEKVSITPVGGEWPDDGDECIQSEADAPSCDLRHFEVERRTDLSRIVNVVFAPKASKSEDDVHNVNKSKFRRGPLVYG